MILLWLSLPLPVHSLTSVSPQQATRPSVVFPLHNTVTEVEGSFSAALLKDHWGREPLLFRRAFASDDSAWPSWEAMVELACEEDGGRVIRHTPGDLTSYTLDVGPFDDLDDLFLEEGEEIGTLVVNDVDRFDPSLSDWIDRTFSFVPRWRRDDAQVSLANRNGGIGPHVDNYDVFLIQTSGKREWQVGVNKVSAQDEVDWTVPGISVRILQDWDQLKKESFVLEAGDVLYLPPRVPHCGTAVSDKCMTLSVGCRAPSATELMSRLAEGLSESVSPRAVDRYEDLDLLLQTQNIHALTDSIKKKMKALVINAVQEVLEDDDQWDALVGCLVTESKRPREDYPLALDDTQWKDELGVWGIPDAAVEAVRNGEGVLFRAEGVSAAYSNVSDTSYRLFMNGLAFDIAVAEEEKEAIESLLSAIAGDPSLTPETLSPLSHQPVVLELLEKLVERGLLYGSSED